MSPRRDPGVKFRTPLKIRRIPGLLSVLLVAVGSFGADSPDVKDATNRLIGSIFNGPSMSNLRDLTDGYGGRLTGSPAYQKATEWVVARFHSYGILNVRVEPFELPNGWQRGGGPRVRWSYLTRGA